MQDFKNLKVWHKSLDQLLDLYKTTEAFPPDEQFRMTDQLRKAADSVKENLAEGCGREGSAELRRFVSMAIGSQFEIESRLISVLKLKLLSSNDFERLNSRCTEIRKMLIALLHSLSSPRKFRRGRKLVHRPTESPNPAPPHLVESLKQIESRGPTVTQQSDATAPSQLESRA